MQLVKWIAAGAMGMLMAGSTLAFAATTLADFPQPFVTATNGIGDTLVVVGSQGDWPAGLASDVAGAIDIASRLGSENKEAYTCSGSLGGTTVSGEGKAVATTNKKLYLQDVPRKTGVRYTMTASDLPTVLASDVLEDTDANTNYAYDQYIEFSNDYNFTFSQARPDTSAAKDPVLKIAQNAATNPSNPETNNYFYKTKVVFQKDVNGTTAIGEKLTLFGKTYTIASGTTFATANAGKLVLQGSADTKVLTEGDQVTVTVGGTVYNVKLNGVSDSDTIVVTVGSDTNTIDKEQTKTIGGLQVYVDNVYYYGSTRTDNQAKVSFGAETVTFENNKKVYTGSGTTTNIKGTQANLTVNNGKLSAMEVYIVPADSVVDAVAVGGKFVDPVFASFNIAFPTSTPALNAATRDTITVQASGDNAMTVIYPDDKGNTATVTWAYKGASDNTPDMTDASDYPVVVAEDLPVQENWYVVLDAGDYTHMLQLTDLNNDGTTTSSVELTDLFSGTKYTFTLGTDNITDAYIDGQLYKIDGTQSTSYVRFTWGDNANYLNPGDQLTIYPRLKGHNGEWMAITNRTLADMTDFAPSATSAKVLGYLDLPTGRVKMTTYGMNNVTLSADTGYTIAAGGSDGDLTGMRLNGTGSVNFSLGKTSSGPTFYQLTTLGANVTTIKVLGSDVTAASAGNSTGLLFIEEEEGANNNINTIFVPVSTETSGSTWQIIAGSPELSSPYVASAALVSDTYKTQYVDLYGTLVEKNTYNQDRVTIWYPDEQMTMDLFVLADGATTSVSGATGGATVNKALPYKTSLAKVDSEVTQTDKETKNLILVGGPIVNSLVKELADASKTKDTAWYATQAAGTGIIDLVNDAWATGFNALVVAGKDAQGTRAATAVVQKYDDYATQLTGSGVVVQGTVITSELS